jgi:hypothetical protein
MQDSRGLLKLEDLEGSRGGSLMFGQDSQIRSEHYKET